MDKIKVATVWFTGCSGCHMSFLDLDEWLFDLADVAEVVYSPIVDVKEYPDGVDVLLVEGGVGTDEQEHFIKDARGKTKIILSFGDCAVTSNVPAMRNAIGGPEHVLTRGYLDRADVTPQIPSEPGILPVLSDRVRPVHEVVKVDAFLPGCPPPASRIKEAIVSLLEQREASLPPREMLKFG